MDKDQGLVLSTESTSASDTHILDVNFDCLHEIFSLQCFSMLDLCCIGESHDRFKDVVDDVFAKRHKNYIVDFWTTTDLEETTRILNNFGSLISQLSIVCRGRNKLDRLLELLTKYCSSTLDSLQLRRLTISQAQTIKLKSIFDKLQKISLFDCTIYSGKTLFSNCQSLVELRLEYVTFDDQHLILENTFSKLDRFEYYDDNSVTQLLLDSNKSNDFFSRHPNLKSLRLYRCHEISLLLPGIVDNCKQLAELDIEIHELDDEVKIENALTCIVSLDHLKRLEIVCRRRNITKFVKKLENSKSLEILNLRCVDGDSEFVLALSKLTKFKELELWWCDPLTNLNPLADLERLTALTIVTDDNLDFDLVHMMKWLINLKTLNLNVSSFTMDEKMYQRIVEAVRERPGRFQDALQISCYTAEDCSADSFGDADCRKLVRIIKLRIIKF